MNLSFTNSFNSLLSGDWVMVLIFLAVALVYGLTMGRSRLAVVTLGIYFSFVLVKALPWAGLAFAGLKEAPSSSVQIFVFLALVLGFYFLIPSSALRGALKSAGRRRSQWWQVLILSILQIGLILEIAISFLSAKVITTLSPLAQTIFVGPWPEFLWLLLPVLALMFLRTKHYETEE